MAFFELIKTLLDDIGDKFKPVGGRGMASFDPDPWTMVPALDAGLGYAHVLDSSGHLHVRGPTMTDEGSFRDDFVGSSLSTALTGTVSFTNNSTTVTGSGTAFLSEINRDRYIKLDAHADSAWARVSSVNSDTELEIEEPYSGATASGASSVSYWIPTTSGTGTVSVATSICTLTSGTTSGNLAEIDHDVDYLPLAIVFRVSVSQRIANQQIEFGLADVPGAAELRACVILTGTDNTQGQFVTSASSSANDTQTTTFTYPAGFTSANTLMYQITLGVFNAVLLINGIEVARHSYHLPGLYDVLHLHGRIENTDTAGSSTTVNFGQILVSNQDQVQIVNSFQSDPITTVAATEDGHYINGLLTTTATTADQVVLSYTVPSGKIMYVLGYSVSVDGAANGNPVKIGRTSVATEPVAPGTVDANVFRNFYLAQSSLRAEDFGTPRRIGVGGDTIVLTVTPSATQSTRWRATIDFTLRSV